MPRPCMTLIVAGALALPVAAAADVEVLRGEFVHGAQVSLFEPCGVDEALWLLEDGESAAYLVAAHTELTTTAYEGVYAELSAERVPNDNVFGVPAEYDALLAVEAVYEVRPLPQPDCR